MLHGSIVCKSFLYIAQRRGPGPSYSLDKVQMFDGKRDAVRGCALVSFERNRVLIWQFAKRQVVALYRGSVMDC